MRRWLLITLSFFLIILGAVWLIIQGENWLLDTAGFPR